MDNRIKRYQKGGGGIKRHRSTVKSLMLVTQLGLSVMTPVFLSIFIGRFIDTRYSVGCTLPFLALGFLAGGRNGWMQIKQILDMDKGEGHEET